MKLAHMYVEVAACATTSTAGKGADHTGTGRRIRGVGVARDHAA